MVFKKLQIYGFKSFAEKTEFNFEPGITAIVGPNGCGKTNIFDGIKWVLGDQSAKSLRGAVMEDVIFNGTVEQEPVNMAEVSLILSNHNRFLPIDYGEVTITRRLFRSGESEYLLNKTPVRLKDIQELLMGTGIGMNSYFLMEQGKMDRVLSSKPEERRAIFEEASGITRYKSKKKEALRKLEQTDANLLRAEDIIIEVKRQIGSIERQAQKARRYKRLFDELKEKEVKVSKIEYKALVDETKSLKEGLENAHKRRAELSANLQALTGELRAARQKMEEIDENLSSANSEIVRLEGALEKNKDRIQMDTDRIEELKVRSEQATLEIANSRGKWEVLKKQVEEQAGKCDAVSHERSAMEESRDTAQTALDELTEQIETAQDFVKQAKEEILESTSNLSRLKNESSRMMADIAALNARKRRLVTEKESLLTEASEIQERLAKATEELTRKENHANSLRSQRDTILKNRDHLETTLKSLEKHSSEISSRLASFKSKVEFLTQMIAEYEGFSDGVKALFKDSAKNEPWFRGVRGVLADLINVPASSAHMEPAIEAALGEELQSVLVADRATAQAAIDFLKREGSGRARFIIQDQMRERRTSPIAQDFIETSAEYIPVLSYILKDTRIVKDLDEAFGVLRRSPVLRVITQDAEIVERASVTGGALSSDDRIGLIGRRAKLEQAQAECRRLESLIITLQEQKQEMQQSLERVKSAMGPLQELLRKAEIEFANKKSTTESVEKQLKKIQDEESLISLELDEAQEELSEKNEKDVQIKESITGLDEKITQLQGETAANQQQIQGDSKKREEVLVQLAECKTKLASLDGKLESLNSSLRVLEESLQAESSLCGARAQTVKESNAKIVELHDETKTLTFEISEINLRKQAILKDTEALRAARTKWLNQIEEKESAVELRQKDLDGSNTSLHELEMKQSEISHKQETIQVRMFETYKVRVDEESPVAEAEEILAATEAQEVEEEPFDIDQVRLDIEALRAKVDSIGNVNLDAVDEQKELEERYEFLTTQKEDLLNAKDQLQKAILKINRTTKQMFIETFQKVQVEFKNLFRLLFGGGETELFLLDDGDVLESGIEIVARPPGKRLQNISLLSGGEKALTAIALLFALFKVKPSPFCILDEIDAPLDESNIDRFARLVQSFTDISQFIMITHNKKTITSSDVMYGITMQKTGVSKVVSVKFAQDKEAAAEETVPA